MALFFDKSGLFLKLKSSLKYKMAVYSMKMCGDHCSRSFTTSFGVLGFPLIDDTLNPSLSRHQRIFMSDTCKAYDVVFSFDKNTGGAGPTHGYS